VREEGVEIAPVERLHALQEALDVVLRHRPRSIPL
jgi:hypothetical protein